MKLRDENRGLLEGAVKRLTAYPLERRKQLFVKGLSMAVAKLMDRQISSNTAPESLASRQWYPKKYPENSGARGDVEVRK